MDTVQLVVTIAGTTLVGAILWFFFGARSTATVRDTGTVIHELSISVSASYNPDRIEVRAGRPVRLKFRRDDPNPCTDQVVFPDFGVVKDLPVGREVVVEVTPPKPGEYGFQCGMNMVRGKLIAK